MAVPSIKATVFQTNADDLAALMAAGRIDAATVERRLDAQDLRYLGKQLAVSSWVPIRTSTKVLELLFEASGEADARTFMSERGRRAAEQLRKSGIYSQLRSQQGLEAVKQVGRIAVSISSLMLNFSRWSFEASEDAIFRIAVEDAAEFPDMNRFAAEGFVEHVIMGLPGNPKVRVDSDRVAPDRIVFTATLL